jgi:amino acid transporter
MSGEEDAKTIWAVCPKNIHVSKKGAYEMSAGSESTKEPPRGNQQHSVAHGNLRSHCLSYLEVLSQSISVIAPSTVPAAVLGLIFAVSGNGTWFSFLLGVIGLLFVSANINQFARRSASPGSLYTYVVKGLGPGAGVLSGWALLFAYMLTGMSTLCGFATLGSLLLEKIGIHANVIVLFAFSTALSCYIAYRDIQLSAKTMLALEAFALGTILVLGILIWRDQGFVLDTTQLTLEGATPSGIIAGIVLVVFGFSGFESSASLGQEAKDPLRTIPRSIVQSVVLSGAVFIFMTYVTVLAFRGTGADLGESEAPLAFLADRMGLGFLGTIVNVGALVSFFACTLASINSTARIVFSMARHGLFYDSLGEAHQTNDTPYIAIVLSALITFVIPTGVYLSGVSAFDAQGHFGTLCSFGFLLVYILISIAAPLYLKSIGRLNKAAWFNSVVGTGFMILPFLGTVGIPGSTLFPLMEFPNDVLLGVFVTYMLIGLGWFVLQKARQPDLVPAMRVDIDAVELQFAEVENVRNRLAR